MLTSKERRASPTSARLLVVIAAGAPCSRREVSRIRLSKAVAVDIMEERTTKCEKLKLAEIEGSYDGLESSGNAMCPEREGASVVEASRW